MRVKRRSRWLSCWLGLPMVLGLSTYSHALVITPARSEIHLVPGVSAPVELTATNDDKVEIQVDVSKKDWFIPEANKVWTVDRWMDIHGPSRFYLKPGESQRIDITLRCPKELVGEVVGMASFLYQTEHPAMVTPIISVSLYLLAAGTEKIGGDVTDIIVRTWNDQVNMTAKVHATGNVHLRPSGRLIVVDSKATEVGAAAVAEGTPTYPGRDALYSGTLPGTVKLLPGSYTARADLAYQGFILQGSRGFTVLPDGQIQMKDK